MTKNLRQLARYHCFELLCPA